MKNADKPITPLHGADGTLFSSSTVDEGAIKSLGLLIGLTKREYFAGLAMQGIISTTHSSTINSQAMTSICSEAIELADQLLKQLES